MLREGAASHLQIDVETDLKGGTPHGKLDFRREEGEKKTDHLHSL